MKTWPSKTEMGLSKRQQRGVIAGVVMAVSLMPSPGYGQDPFAVDERIVFPAKLDQQPAMMLYDTGASMTALFQGRAEGRGIVAQETRSVSVAGNEVLMGISAPVDFSLFGTTENTRMKLFPTNSVAGCDGVISWKSLIGKPIYIDARGKRVKAVDLDRLNRVGWQRWEMDGDSSQLFFLATDGEKEIGRVFVDTGAVVGLRLSPALWKEWRRQNPDAPTTFETFRYSVGEPMTAEMGWADEYRLGDLILRHVDVGLIPGVEGEEKAIDAGGKEFVAMLGIRALRNLRLIVNAGEEEVLTQSLGPVPIHNRLGAVFVPDSKADGDDENAALMARVLPGSPAEKAGLKPGDALLEINGFDFRKESRGGRRPDVLFQLPAGTELKIRIQRGEKERELTAMLEEILP